MILNVINRLWNAKVYKQHFTKFRFGPIELAELLHLFIEVPYQARKEPVMYLCVMGTKPGKNRSCICVLWVSSQEITGHVFVCYGYQARKEPVMYLCVRGIKPGKNPSCTLYVCVKSTKPGKNRSCICVL